MVLLPGTVKTCVAPLLQRCEIGWKLLSKDEKHAKITTAVENDIESKLCHVKLAYHKSTLTMYSHVRAKHRAEGGELQLINNQRLALSPDEVSLMTDDVQSKQRPLSQWWGLKTWCQSALSKERVFQVWWPLLRPLTIFPADVAVCCDSDWNDKLAHIIVSFPLIISCWCMTYLNMPSKVKIGCEDRLCLSFLCACVSVNGQIVSSEVRISLFFTKMPIPIIKPGQAVSTECTQALLISSVAAPPLWKILIFFWSFLELETCQETP